ncbi:MAG: flotillin domain-containing protein [Candidatus Poribacteria bacterium]|nr:flotillin domain-containing protein [Candidatus Poribacteria bacterium]
MRLIALVITLLVVAILVGFFSYQQADDLNLRGLARWTSISLVVVFVLSAVFIAFVVRYKKPKADMSLVRTGGSGEKVNITAGLWINTIIHEVKEISLNTMVIEVLREGADAFITLDYNRADVEAVFYLQVEPNEEDILRAAQALGDKSMTPETIRELIEPKLEGALRSVAAESEIAELLQRRVEFADKVEDAVGENLKQENGLKLEAVSIIRVDQTPIDTYNPDNQFDARGIRIITEITAEQAKEQERIVQEKEVAIVQIDVDARIQKLEAEQGQAWAESDQQKNIAIYAAEREADTMKFQFEMEQDVQEREYLMKQEVEKARISQDQAVQEREIEMTKEVELAKVDQEQTVQVREIEKNLIVETEQIEQMKAVRLAEIEQELTVEMEQMSQEQQLGIREQEKVLEIERAKITQEEGVALRDIEKTLSVETTKFAQEQAVQEREIEKNLVIETAQINQTRQVELAEIDKLQMVEVARFGQEEVVGIREQEKVLEIERATINQEEGVAIRDIEKDLSVETTKFAQEQVVQEREIEKNLVLETAQIRQNRQVELTEIDKILDVEQSRIGQELTVQLKDEDRNIEVAQKQVITANSQRDQLVAEADKAEAEVNVIAAQQLREAEWQRDVAVIGSEAQAQPIERLADAVLAEAMAKAQGEMAHMEARNVAEQRVLVQEAILELIETAPDLAEQLMRPVEKIDSIKILDMGGTDGKKDGVDRSSMGRLANNLLDTGAVSPMLKELFDFADVDAQKIADKISEYLANLTRRES